MIPPIPGLCLTTLFHGWVVDPPAGLIDQSITGSIHWRTAYETVRAIVGATAARWLAERPITEPAN